MNFDTESLSDAYDQSDESGLTPTWINTEKALAQKPTKTVIFYFTLFYIINCKWYKPKKVKKWEMALNSNFDKQFLGAHFLSFLFYYYCKFQDVFVVDPFEGVGFEHLMRYRCTIVGPRCLLTCLQKGEPVPDLPYPMYTASFRYYICFFNLKYFHRLIKGQQ